MRKFSLPRRIAASMAVPWFVVNAFAATINANVQDAALKAIPGIAVTLTSKDGKPIDRKVTDARGLVTFSSVPAGDYTLAAARANAPEVRREIEVAESDISSVTLVADEVTRLPTLGVTATRMKEAQIDLSPKVGTTIHTIDEQLIDEFGVGANASMNDVLLRFPGVAQDSKASGSLHVRDEHANVQYRINGIALPEGISGFGQSVDTRFVSQIDFLTGALPAQYGQRTAGIVDIQTKDGALDTGGSAGVLVGGQNTFEPSVELVGSHGPLSYYLTGNYMTSTLGIENPTSAPTAIHDRTQQVQGFAYLSYLANDDTRIATMLGTYQGKYQIPNNPAQTPGFSLQGVSDVNTGFNALPSAQLDDNQREVNNYAVFVLQQTLGKLSYQAAVFNQYSYLHYMPDIDGDLIYTGTASDSFRSNSANGIQADAAYRIADSHTLRFGGNFENQFTRSNNTVSVFQTDAAGNQVTNIPTAIVDNSSKSGNLLGLYVQDEWRALPQLTVNYGIRFDQVSAFTHENQWSPRVNLLYKFTPDTAMHAGFSRYFSPPPQELVSQSSIALYEGTTNAPEVPYSDPVRSERASYYDLGLVHKFSPKLTATVDGYYKQVTNLLDEGQFGQALILSPFNYAQGYQEGVEVSAAYTDAQWTGYFNFAAARAKGKNIVSGQSLFGADELAYIADHYIYLDHDQRYSLSAGVAYRFGTSRVSGDLIYGSGLRATPDGAPPNSASLPEHTQVNVALTHDWNGTRFGDIEGRIAIINLFDESFLIRDGTGVGVGAPQYGLRRTLYLGLTSRF